jgi:hypothetical protein
MRYPASGKLEIIRMVEGSHLPTKQTQDMLGISRTTVYRRYDLYLEGGLDGLSEKPSRPRSVWNRTPETRRDDLIEFALEHEALSTRELAVKYTDENRYFVSESSAHLILKEADFITAPNYVVIKAANEFKDKTTGINQTEPRPPPTSSRDHLGRTDIAKVLTGECEMNCSTARYFTRCGKLKSLSKDGETISTPNDPIVHWAIARLRRMPLYRWTKGQSCTNIQIGPLKWGCSVYQSSISIKQRWRCRYSKPFLLICFNQCTLVL